MELYTLFPGERLALQCLEHQEETQHEEEEEVQAGEKEEKDEEQEQEQEETQEEVRWTKQGVPLGDGERVRLREGRLEIEAVEVADAGLYRCFSFRGPHGRNHTAFFAVNVTGMYTWV